MLWSRGRQVCASNCSCLLSLFVAVVAACFSPNSCCSASRSSKSHTLLLPSLSKVYPGGSQPLIHLGLSTPREARITKKHFQSWRKSLKRTFRRTLGQKAQAELQHTEESEQHLETIDDLQAHSAAHRRKEDLTEKIQLGIEYRYYCKNAPPSRRPRTSQNVHLGSDTVLMNIQERARNVSFVASAEDNELLRAPVTRKAKRWVRVER